MRQPLKLLAVAVILVVAIWSSDLQAAFRALPEPPQISLISFAWICQCSRRWLMCAFVCGITRSAKFGGLICAVEISR